VPCIAVTGLGRPEDHERALEAGYDAHVRKPFDPGHLCMTIAALVESRSRQPAKREDRPKSARGLHVLLAEDNPTIAEMLKATLEARGHRVSAVQTIAGGLAVAKQSAVDIVLSDLRLKDGMGWELMAKLQSERVIPGVAMSGYDDQAYVAKSKAAGFNEYLIKPVDEDQLLAAIRRLTDPARNPADPPAG
jgi:CheY-like chemotaxis protein